MDNQREIAILIGNLQAESPNRKLSKTLVFLSPPSLLLRVVEIDKLPLYNEDLETDPPQQWREFRVAIDRSRGVLLITPEHLRSIPAVLMNALDVGSMPKATNVWADKPVAIAGVATGTIGPYSGHEHLRSALSFLHARTMPAPDLYLGNPDLLFDDKGNLGDHGTRQLVKKFIREFETWVSTE